MQDSISILNINYLTNGIIIDIRDYNLYNKSHIDNAINIPFSKLILYPNRYLNKNSKYYIYCQKGFKSRLATLELLKKGYDVVNLYEGYELYEKHKKM